jgi:hypothetical protein
MKPKVGLLIAAILTIVVLPAHAQAPRLAGGALARSEVPCDVSTVLADSARDEFFSVLSANGPSVQEFEHDLGVSKVQDFAPARLVRDGLVCSRAKAAFNHQINSGARVTVLRVGPVYYARDPDQSQTTGIVLDTTFKVLMRFGRAVP